MNEGIFLYLEAKCKTDTIPQWREMKLPTKDVHLKSLDDVDGNWLFPPNKKQFPYIKDLLQELESLHGNGDLFFSLEEKGGKSIKIEGYLYYSQMVKYFYFIVKAISALASLDADGKAVFLSDINFSISLFEVRFGFLFKNKKIKSLNYDSLIFDKIKTEKDENYLKKLPYIKTISKNFTQWLTKFPEKKDILENTGKWGYMKRSGEFLIKPKFTSADQFHEGLAKVDNNYIDEKGKIIITPDINEKDMYYFKPEKKNLSLVFNFQEGLARVELYNDKKEYYDFDTGYSDIYKYGFINKKGAWAIHPIFDDASDFSENRAGVRIKNKFGFIDKSGKLIIPADFDKANYFKEGHCCVQKNAKWEYINDMGKTVIDGKYDAAWDFDNGIAKVMIDNKIGCIDISGKFIIKPEFDWVGNFSSKNSIAFIKKGNKYSYIKKNGKFLTDIWFDEADNFIDNIARVRKNQKWGYIDDKGHYIVEPKYEAATNFTPKFAAAKLRGNWEIINTKGEKILDLKGIEIQSIHGDSICFKENKRVGMMNVEGKIIIKPIFEAIEDKGESEIMVKYPQSADIF